MLLGHRQQFSNESLFLPMCIRYSSVWLNIRGIMHGMMALCVLVRTRWQMASGCNSYTSAIWRNLFFACTPYFPKLSIHR